MILEHFGHCKEAQTGMCGAKLQEVKCGGGIMKRGKDRLYVSKHGGWARASVAGSPRDEDGY